MVKGLNLFTRHFSAFTDHYILIGGGACDVHFGEMDINFRVTKDLDIVLVVEAIDNSFVEHFWDFVKAGRYIIAEVDSKKCFYRFINPVTEGYPKMLELFARKPDIIKGGPGFHITDIPTGEEVSSLSAILMDDDYYAFTISNSELISGAHVASRAALICLKTRAFLNNKKRKDEGHAVQEGDIGKHKKDVFRLVSILDPDQRVKAPTIIDVDLREYIQVIREDETGASELLQQLGLGNVTLEEIIQRLQDVFGI